MKDDIKYSVIIPHYNSEYLIERALKSIPVQEDIQTIVVDDYSTEDSIREIANKEEFSHVEFVFPDTKVTSGGARNIGLNKARGKYVFFVDSDDYLAENTIDIFNSISQTQKDMYQFRAESFLEDSGEIGSGTRLKHFLKYYEMENREGLLCIGTPWAKLIKRKFIEDNRIRFSEVPPNHGDDIFFSTQVAVHCKTFEFSREVVYFVSQGVVNSTSSHDIDCYIGLLKQTTKCNELIKKSRCINSFNYFKNIRHRRWLDLAFQINDTTYTSLLPLYLKSLPRSVVLYWRYLNFLGKLMSPQLHFSSSRNIDICYVLRQGTRKKLIVNFNDFGSFIDDSPESERYPYYFVNTFKKTRQSVLDLRDFWGKYGVYYLQHNGEKIDVDINECIELAISLLNLKKEDVLLFGIGKGGTAAIYYANKFGYNHSVSINPHTLDENFLNYKKKIFKAVQSDLFLDSGSLSSNNINSLFDKEFCRTSDTTIVYSDPKYTSNRMKTDDLWSLTGTVRDIIKKRVLTF